MATSCCQIEILRQAVAEMPWGHNILILNKIPDFPARQYSALVTDTMRLQRKPKTDK
jgi:predicted nuclease of restriction endonuclease-like (RecB) superfamily